MRQATGVADLALIGDPSDGGTDGLTDCGYTGREGALYVQVTIWTGEAKVGFDSAWDEATAGAEPLPGIGDAAAYSSQSDGAEAGAKVGDVGISVAFLAIGEGALDGIDLRAAVVEILATVVARV